MQDCSRKAAVLFSGEISVFARHSENSLNKVNKSEKMNIIIDKKRRRYYICSMKMSALNINCR